MKNVPGARMKPVAVMIAAAILIGAAVRGPVLRAEESQHSTPDWPAFRGGPERLGATPNADGPLVAAKVAWRHQDNSLERVDSSPCVVGDRVYVGTGTLRLIGDSTGMIRCHEIENGGTVWSWTGKDFADEAIKADWNKVGKKLQPVFSSPSVGGRFKDKAGLDRSDHYLVVGEGYDLDWASRVLCLDLEPVANGESKTPRLKWFKQTTCHVESSPCILDGRAYIGAADDGVWCIDLETGRTLWRAEGTSAYYVVAGDQAAELEKRAGKYVKAVGAVERLGATWDEPGQVRFEVEKFEELKEGQPLPVFEELDNGRTFRRVVVGKVTRVEKSPTITVDNKQVALTGISAVSIVPEEVFPDAESSPIAVRLPRDKANPKAAPADPKNPQSDRIQVFFGSGLGGERVVCLDGTTGRRLWETEKLGFPVFGSPTVVDGRVIVGVGNGDISSDDANPKGEVHCLSAADGSRLWQFKAGNTFLGAVPVFTDEKGRLLAYACCRNKNLYILDVKDQGKVAQKVAVGSPMVCSPAVTRDAVYVTTGGGKVVCVDRKTGAVRWSLALCPGQTIISSPAVAGSRLFVGSVNKGLFCVINDPEAAAETPPRP